MQFLFAILLCDFPIVGEKDPIEYDDIVNGATTFDCCRRPIEPSIQNLFDSSMYQFRAFSDGHEYRNERSKFSLYWKLMDGETDEK